MDKKLEIYIDGASKGNPGLAAIGIVIKQDGQEIRTLAKTIGQATNNTAEYTALIFALKEAQQLKALEVRIYSDSLLVCQQITGHFKVKNEKLRLLWEQVRHLTQSFNKIEAKHIPREENRQADRLANEAIKKEQTKMVALAVPG